MPTSLPRPIACMLPASMGRSSSANGRRALAALALGSLLGLVGCAKIEARDLIREGNALYKDAKFVEAMS